MKILTAQQMRDTDRLTTERYNIDSLQLMENAGAGIADYLWTAYPNLTERRVLVLCGRGNNGGDGLVVARHLRDRGVAARVILLADPSAFRGEAEVNLKRWRDERGEFEMMKGPSDWPALRPALFQCELIVDALLGTGLTRPVEGPLAEVIEDINAARKQTATPVVSVDMPSGLSADTEDHGGPIVQADITVTLTAPKVGQMLNPRADRTGKLIVRQIGTPSSLLEDDPDLKLHWLEPAEFRALPMIRTRDANKGSYGHALIIAGSLGKSGAAAMAGRAALRVGAGLVTVTTPLPVLLTVAAGTPELMTFPLASNDAGSATTQNLDGRLTEILHAKSVLAMGPGLSANDDTQQFIRQILAQTNLPIILDADGLNAFANHTDLLSARKSPQLAMTPHPGEMARLLGASIASVQSRRLDVARESAAKWRANVILKGSHTILATPDGHAYINTTGNPGMATGGTGDVLTGMLAGLTAEFAAELGADFGAKPEANSDANPKKNSPPLKWATVLGLGVYLHGLAGDAAAARVGEAPLIATDLIEALPEVFANFISDWKQTQTS